MDGPSGDEVPAVRWLVLFTARWSLLRDAPDPAGVVPGAVLVAGTERFWSVVRIEQVDDDGQVHFVAVPADDPAAARLLARSA